MGNRQHKIVELFLEKGKSQYYISKIFNISTSKVDKLLTEWKIKYKRRRKIK